MPKHPPQTQNLHKQQTNLILRENFAPLAANSAYTKNAPYGSKCINNQPTRCSRCISEAAD